MLGIGQIVGMSAGELFYIANGIRDDNPDDWRNRFSEHADYLENEAELVKKEPCKDLLSHLYFSAAYSLRAALQFTDPNEPEFMEMFQKMEKLFALAIENSDIPLKSIEVPFEGKNMPGYAIINNDIPRDTLIVVGGGDTSREDLYYMLGYSAWQNGFNVLMVDLPGQGKNPEMGLCFSADAGNSISAILDWYKAPTENIAIAGFSGGWYFTVQAVEKDKRIKAWIASTPIFDVGEVFRVSFAAALKTPKAILKLGSKILTQVNKIAGVNLKKYAWQLGESDFITAVNKVFDQAQPVDYKKIDIPSLFLLGAEESPELMRQSEILLQDFKERGIDVTLKKFSSDSGADAHCQVNNLRLMHYVVFDW